jgi:hypothetical protein
VPSCSGGSLRRISIPVRGEYSVISIQRSLLQQTANVRANELKSRNVGYKLNQQSDLNILALDKTFCEFSLKNQSGIVRKFELSQSEKFQRLLPVFGRNHKKVS